MLFVRECRLPGRLYAFIYSNSPAEYYCISRKNTIYICVGDFNAIIRYIVRSRITINNSVARNSVVPNTVYCKRRLSDVFYIFQINRLQFEL